CLAEVDIRDAHVPLRRHADDRTGQRGGHLRCEIDRQSRGRDDLHHGLEHSANWSEYEACYAQWVKSFGWLATILGVTVGAAHAEPAAAPHLDPGDLHALTNDPITARA